MLNTTTRIASLVFGVFAVGQPFGSFAGAIVDPVGGVLPGVKVVLSQAARQARYEAVTDRTGQFEIPGLPPGDYQIDTELAGFQAYQSTVTIANAPMRRTITLKIGQLHETITVREQASPAPPPKAARAYTDPPCPTAAAAAGAIGGNLRPPVKLRDAKPDYPASLRGSGRDVVAVVEARVGLDGFLKDIHATRDVDPAVLDSLVLALREWRFSSTLLNCIPQEVDMIITASFEHQ